MPTIVYSERMYPDLTVEHAVFGPDVRIEVVPAKSIEDIPPALAAAADGLMVFRHFLTAGHLAAFPRLRAVVRMGVGYDRLDRAACAARGILVCNLPDYGTAEVADHAIALTLALRRGLLLHDREQTGPAPGWTVIRNPAIRRLEGTCFGIVGLGLIGTATALRAKALGMRVLFHDPFLPNGVDRALGVARAPTLEALLEASDTLSLHAPLTRATSGLVGEAALRRLPRGALVINTARGPILDIEALHDAMADGHVAGAGLDVLPEEPPGAVVPRLLAAYRARAPWLDGRLIVTPHSAFHTPESWHDIRVKGAETMRAALLTNAPQNVVPPDAE